MKNISLTGILLLLLFFTACKEPSTYDFFQDYDDWYYAEGEADYFFEGVINDQPVRINFAVDKYRMQFAAQSRFITSSNTLSVDQSDITDGSGRVHAIWRLFRENSDGQFKMKPDFAILGPAYIDSVPALSTIFREWITGPGDLPLVSDEIPDTDGFQVEIALVNNDRSYAVSGKNPQPNSYLRVTEYEEVIDEETDESIITLTFEFSASLYEDNPLKEQNDYFGRLEDGVFRTTFRVPAVE